MRLNSSGYSEGTGTDSSDLMSNGPIVAGTGTAEHLASEFFDPLGLSSGDSDTEDAEEELE